MFGIFARRRKGAGRAGSDAPAFEVEPGPAFHLPGIEDRTAALDALGEVRRRLAGPLKAEVPEQPFAALNYTHDQFSYRTEVGATDPRANETVRAILRQPARRRFLILTDRHGFRHGLPLLVPEREVSTAVSFRDG
jgi:hypothetical protein